MCDAFSFKKKIKKKNSGNKYFAQVFDETENLITKIKGNDVFFFLNAKHLFYFFIKHSNILFS